MGYILYAFMGRMEAIQPVEKRFILRKDIYKNASLCELREGMNIIPVTEALFDEINDYQQSPEIGKFALLTKYAGQRILPLIREKQVACIEAEYHGGHGGQSGIVRLDRKRIYQQMSAKGVFNQIVQLMGVMAKNSLDEFDTVGLDQHRETEALIKE